MNKTKRVFTLYRASTLGQVEKDDIPMQKEACRRFLAENPDWQLERNCMKKAFPVSRNPPRNVTPS